MEQNPIELKNLGEQVLAAHGKPGMATLAFGLAAPFAPFIRKKLGGFPLLYLHGEPSTGKSGLANAVRALCAPPRGGLSLTGNPSTDRVRLRRNIAEHPNEILLIEEYRNVLPGEVLEMLKAAWDGSGYARGSISATEGTDPVVSSIAMILTGYEYPTADNALLSRMLVVMLENPTFTPEQMAAWKRLMVMINEGYHHLSHALLALQPWVERRFDAELAEVRSDLDTRFAGTPIPSRMVMNIATILAVHRSLRPHEGLVYSYTELRDELSVCVKRQWERMEAVKA